MRDGSLAEIAVWEAADGMPPPVAPAPSPGAADTFDPYLARDQLRLLVGQGRYDAVIAFAERLPPAWRDHPHILAGLGHARLARGFSRDAMVAVTEARATSPDWLGPEALLDRLERAVRERRPFSLVRVGDGEARFAIGVTRGARLPVAPKEADAMAALTLRNWFGPAVEAGDPNWGAVYRRYRLAVADADVIGACGPERMRGDPAHFGYLAWKERWLMDLFAGRRPLWTDALGMRDVDRASPFLGRLLANQDVVGFVSPHAGLAHAARQWLHINRVVEHVVPGEMRLNLSDGLQADTSHFPAVYEQVLASLEVPRPGCVFLVAAGLLGKIYCARIKALGGVALDIGALADAWMGRDTRNGHYRTRPPLPRAWTVDEAAQAVTGCLSIGKTGSMALTAALTAASDRQAFHLHYLGPHALRLKPRGSEPMRHLAEELASQAKDPRTRFRVVVSVRDPVARLLSQAFYRSAKGDAATDDPTRSSDALVRWWETTFGRDVSDEWFDDSLRATFGFDFRRHLFDLQRRSLRFQDERLKLLVLRLEDPLADRERELGWLMDCPRVPIPPVNTAASEGYAARYDKFRREFRAPTGMLDRLYQSEVLRHFYSDEERRALLARWT